jgi:hypothetical protein
MKKLNARERFLAGAAAAAVFLPALYLLVIGPMVHKFRETDKGIQQLRVTIRKYYELERQQPVLMEGYKRIERYLQLKGTDNEKLTALLTTIETEAKAAGITVVDLKPVLSQTKTSKAISALSRVHLSGEGGLEQVGQFLYNLNQANIFFAVESFTLLLKDETKGTMKVEVDILGVAFS